MGAFHSRTCNPDHTCPEGRSHLVQNTGKAKRSEPSRDACTELYSRIQKKPQKSNHHKVTWS